MQIAFLGIDLGKNRCSVAGLDASGRVVLRRRMHRDGVVKLAAQLPACVVAMEATRSANHWARVLAELGHEVKLIAPQFVKPYVKANKTDAADAEAICEAATRPTMRFVPVKTVDQQAALSLHRARSGLVKARTAIANQMRGLLGHQGTCQARDHGF